MRKAYIIGVLLIVVLLILGACTPAPEPAPAPTPTPTPEDSLTAPKLLSPHNRATDIELRPRFLWEPVPDAMGYELIVSLSSDLFSDIVHNVSLELTAFQPSSDLTTLTQYYWMVVAKMDPADPDMPTACSEVWAFTTAEEPVPTPPLKPPPLPEPPAPSPEPIEITAAQLSTEYDEIGLVAETKYKNQLLEVSGTVDYFGLALGSPFISFETDPDAWEIRAFLTDDEEVSKAETLSKGDEIVVIGTCRGSSGWYRIILSDCHIIIP